jgi:hypothetical protein
LIEILLGFAFSHFGSTTFSTPFVYSAATSLVSTSQGKVIVLEKQLQKSGCEILSVMLNPIRCFDQSEQRALIGGEQHQ